MGRETVKKWIKDLLPKRCMNCGSTKDLQYHHIVPYSVGGNEVPSNISVLCIDCHSKIHYDESGKIAHSQLVRDGIARAKTAGVKLGRRRKDTEELMRLIAEKSTQFNPESEMTESEIMALASVKPTTYFKYKRELLKAMNADIWPYEWDKPRTARHRPQYNAKIIASRDAGKRFDRMTAMSGKHPNGKDIAPWEVTI